MAVTLAKNLDVSKIVFDSVKKNALGGKIVYLSYNGEKKITMQTTEVSAPFGLSAYTDETTGNVRYSLDYSYRGMDSNPKIKLLHDKMTELDNLMIDTGVANSKDWFGKKMSREVVEALYRPIVKPAKDPEKYAPTTKLKIVSNDKGMKVLAFDNTKQPFDLTTLTSGASVAAIIECSSVWFVNKQFGVTWRLVQAKVNQPTTISGCAFVDSDAEDDDDDEDAANVEKEESDPDNDE